MPVELPTDHLGVVALCNRVEMLEGENKYVNDENDALRESNGQLALENEELKKQIALAETRLEHITNFWRAAESELTSQIGVNESLNKQLEAAKSEPLSGEKGSKSTSQS
ncbi:hypothetical protein FGADI_8554 [Fusarium gaditjirri]|uniref:Uncharacterized protein n=1 Tax=Fusarium gaditjirri TaxID=282569 RepID=A0A8H4WTA5_9HYPO|nr:hypothetical protein FGADI_8554 [Fusarium gaditjirri]